jgi:DNA replication initiation complex subunit (GINS family)
MAPIEEMGFKFIQQIQQKESRGQNLTKVPADFFVGLSEHIARLRQLARDETARDPMSTTATLVQNELKNTLRLAQDIVSLRLRKMANRAVDALEGGKVDLRSLTPSEKELYDQLAKFMAAAKGQLAPKEGMISIPAPPPVIVQPDDVPEPNMGPPISTGAAPEPPDEGASSTEAGEPTILIHVLKDTPSFAGEGGRTHSLKRGDIVTLSQKLAEVLVSRGMAEEVTAGQ